MDAGAPWSGTEWEGKAMKACSRCEETKDANAFAPRKDAKDGRRSVCRDCRNTDVRRRYHANPEPTLIAAKQARKDDPERFKAIGQRSQQRHYAKRHANVVAWNERNPAGYKAHIALNNAVALGKIERPDACQRCGEHTRVDGHHNDYSNPLQVEWLCRRCHVSIARSGPSND
jgi:hypothetical protein